MKNFAAIDFETANFNRSSVCSVGVVVVRNGEITDKYYSLIRPEPNFYNTVCKETNGLSCEDTDNAPVFPDVWKEIASKIDCLPLVAHNKSFDENCLKSAFSIYNMEYSDYKFYCTLEAARRELGGNVEDHQLHTVAKYCGYDLQNHHHALADAEACAVIAMKLIKEE